MAIINFQGERDFTRQQESYQQLVNYLVDLETTYPKLYRKLLQVPQFEYDIEVYRHYANRSLKQLFVIKKMVRSSQKQNRVAIQKIKIWRRLALAFQATLSVQHINRK